MKISDAHAVLTNRHLLWWLLLAGLFLSLTGVRLWVLQDYGTPLPYLDEWVLELPFLLSYKAGELDFQTLMVTANEHRNVWPRLISLAFFALNGQQWDPQLPMLVNAGAAAAIMAVTAGFLMRGLADRQKLIFVGGALLIGLQPWDWFSVVWGIQMLSYLLVLLSITGMALVALYPLRGAWFWLGVFLLLNAHLTMASGFAAAACAAILFAWRALLRPGDEPRVPNLIKCGLCVVVASLIIFSRASTTLGRESAGIGEFLIALSQHLAFPFSLHLGKYALTWVGLLIPVPVILLGILYVKNLRAKMPGRRQIELCLLLAGWFLLQFGTMAWFRGSGGEGPALRHLQIHQVWLLVCLGSVFWSGVLLRHTQFLPRTLGNALARRLALTFYVTLMGTGGLLLTAQTAEYLQERTIANATRLRNIQNFLRTGDPQPLLDARWPKIPWKDSAQLVSILSDPRVRSILPAGVRSPLTLPAPANKGQIFSPENLPPHLSYVKGRNVYGSYQAPGTSPHAGTSFFGPLSTRFSHVIIWVAGDLGDIDISLFLTTVDKQQISYFTPVDPQSPLPIYAGQTWTRYQAEVPDGDFLLVASDQSADGWITFSQPFEANQLSLVGATLRHNWLNSLFVGIFLLVWALLGLVSRQTRVVAVAK